MLGVCLSRTYYAFVAFLDLELERCDLAADLSPGMGHVLYRLLSEDDLTPTQLSVRARLAQSTITGIVARMESGGLVERHRHEQDGRAYRLGLTARARALRPRLEELGRGCARAYARELNDTEIATLKALLGRLHAAITVPRADKARPVTIRGRPPFNRKVGWRDVERRSTKPAR